MDDAAGLPSWRDGASRSAILDFVHRIEAAGPDYVPPAERVAVFDNDGTLWCEKPLPVQADFLLRKVGEMAERDPSLRDRQPWKSVYEKDYRWLSEAIDAHYRGDDSAVKAMAAGLLQAYAGQSIESFQAEADQFLKSAVNPRFQKPYVACTFQPMLELLRFLETRGFTCYIASGGGRDFVRCLAEDLYGLPADRVVGSSVSLGYVADSETNTLVHQPGLDVFDDGPQKPVQIWSRVGRRPILAAGNSNGDIEMLEFAGGSRPALRLLLHHDDADREFAYDTGAEKSLERAKQRDWTVVSMKDDWSSMFRSAA